MKNPQPASDRTAHSQPRRPETLLHIAAVASNLCLFPPSLFMLRLLFSFLPSQWRFPKYDIITQRLSEGSATRGALEMQLQFDVFQKKKKYIPPENFTQGC